MDAADPGRGLDPGLFRVSSLLRAETTARLPVTVSYRGRVPSLPGVTISRARGTAFVLSDNGLAPQPLNKDYRTEADNPREPKILRKRAPGRDAVELRELAKSIGSSPASSGDRAAAIAEMFGKLRKA